MLEYLGNLYTHWQSVINIAIVLLVTLAVALVVRHCVHRFRTQDTDEHVWRNAILDALNAPLRCLVWAIGISVAEQRLTAGVEAPFFTEAFPTFRDIIIVGLVAWFLIRFNVRVIEALFRRARFQGKPFDQTSADAVGKTLTAIVAILAILYVMQRLGFSLASLLTFGGVAGIALGFAAQGLVSNLLGGVTIFASKPFKVGDHIVLPGSSFLGKAGYIGWQAGEVEHIGWRATRIVDWNGKPFYLPNAKFNSETIINHSRMHYREISEYVYIRLEDVDRVADIVTEVNRVLGRHPKLSSYIVFQLDGFGEYALRLYLYAYTIGMIKDYPDYLPVKQDVLLKIAGIIADNGAKLAVPVATVYMPDGTLRHHERRQDFGLPGQPGETEVVLPEEAGKS